MLKKIKLGLVALLLPVMALAQSYPSPTFNNVTVLGTLTGAISGGTLTNPTITGGTITGTTGVTQGRLDNSTLLATDAFVNQQGAAAVATVPFANTTGGVFNQATLGSGAQLVFLASGGSVSSILSVAMGGTGYAVGDLLILPAGNSDALVRVTAVSSGAITTASIIYGGTGYMTGAQVPVSAIPPGRRAVVMTGTLTSNVTFIIQNGTYLTASREIEFINNTTGAFTVTVYLSNGAGGHTGTGVVIPQGTNNSAAQRLYTDGVNDVWPVIGSPLPASVPLTSLATQAANTVVANVTGSTASPTAFVMPSCSTSASALNYTSGTGWGCNTAVNAAQLGGATFAAPGPIGSTTASTGAFTTLSANSTVSGTGFTTLLSPYAPLASPAFTSVPTAPTAAVGTNTTQLATTAFDAAGKPCPSILDFGGDPTGASDNSAAWANTIAGQSSTNACVYFPKGTYKFTSALSYTMSGTSYSSISIRGEGSERTVLNFPTTAGITVNMSNQFSIFHIRGFTATTGTTNAGSCIKINQSQATIANPANTPLQDFQDVVCRGADGAGNTDYWTIGFEVVNQSNINWLNTLVAGSTTHQGTGYSIHGDVNRPPNIFNLTGITSVWNNVGIEYGNYVQGVTCTQCNFTGDNYGINVAASLSILVQLSVNNSQFNCFTAALNMNSPVADFTFNGNTVFVPGTGSTIIGLALNQVGRYSIVGNSFSGYNTLTNIDLVVVGTNTNGGVISANSFNAAGFGIVLQSTSRLNNVQSNVYSSVTTPVTNSAPAACPATSSGNCVGGGSQ